MRGSFDFSDLAQYAEQLNALDDQTIDKWFDDCVKELAARLLHKVIKRTPVGDYSTEVTKTAKRTSKNHAKGETYKVRVNRSGKIGGTLRRGWTANTEEEARSGSGHGMNPTQYVDSLTIQRSGEYVSIEIINPVEYAGYVENGHRTRNHRGFVQGKHMLKISEEELEAIKPQVLEARLKKLLRGVGR